MTLNEPPAGADPGGATERACDHPGADILAGVIFLLVAAGFAWGALGYELGSARRMGPGLIPLGLSAVLGVIGVVILVAGVVGTPRPVPWLGLFNICVAIALFGTYAREAGLVPTVFVCALLAGLGSRRNTPLSALVVAVALTAISWLVFRVGLGVQIPPFGPLFNRLGGA